MGRLPSSGGSEVDLLLQDSFGLKNEAKLFGGADGYCACPPVGGCMAGVRG